MLIIEDGNYGLIIQAFSNLKTKSRWLLSSSNPTAIVGDPGTYLSSFPSVALGRVHMLPPPAFWFPRLAHYKGLQRYFLLLPWKTGTSVIPSIYMRTRIRELECIVWVTGPIGGRGRIKHQT